VSLVLAVSACSRSPTRPIPPLVFVLLLLSLHLAPRETTRLFSMRQFNDATRSRLFAVAGEKRARGESTETHARDFIRDRAIGSSGGDSKTRFEEIDFSFMRTLLVHIVEYCR